MAEVSINSLKRKYKGIDDEFLHQAEMLIIMFNFWPEVQRKWLIELGFKPEAIEKVMAVSDLYAKKKVELMNKKLPKNRVGVILIENDVIESIYEPRIMTVKESDKVKALMIAQEYIMDNHPGALVINHSKIDELEALMNLEGRSVDFLVFTNKGVISYQVELA